LLLFFKKEDLSFFLGLPRHLTHKARMNVVDLLVLAVVAISGLLGLSRGLVREFLGLGSWLLAGYGAYRLSPALTPMMQSAIGDPDIAGPAAFALTFVLLLIALSLLANLVGRAVQVSALGGLDRTLGLVFGVLRGALVLIAAYIPLALLLPPEKWPPAAIHARSVPWIYAGAVWVAAKLPAEYRPRVPPPPDGPPTTSAALLHATPEGRALGPPIVHTN
jgi:membrane protein required for colicin V production